MYSIRPLNLKCSSTWHIMSKMASVGFGKICEQFCKKTKQNKQNKQTILI